MNIQISEHFNYRKLIRFTIPTIAMMIFTSIYGVAASVILTGTAEILAGRLAAVFVSYDAQLFAMTTVALRFYSIISIDFVSENIVIPGCDDFSLAGIAWTGRNLAGDCCC